MNLILYAIPFFLISILIEIVVDRVKKGGRYRINDAVNSLSLGSISRTIGLFTALLPAYFMGLAAESFAVIDLPDRYFDPSTLAGFAGLFAVIVAYDFTYYWKHRFGHEFAFFWGSHSAHHQSEEYNLTTALRQTSMGWILLWLFNLPIILMGVPMEAFIIAAAINLIYQFWPHTQYIDRMPEWFEYVFVTPSNHRVHHAQNDKYLDKNYGGIFILWDRMFGTFVDEDKSEPPVFGIRKPLKSWNPFYANLQVYHQMFLDSWRTRSWADKLRVWYGATGWRPADVAEQYPIQYTDGINVTKYDPHITGRASYYALFQFILGMLATVPLMLFAKQFSLAEIALLCVPQWLTLYSVGMLTEGRSYAVTFEWFRLALFAAAATALAVTLPEGTALIATTISASYLLLSALWLSLVPAQLLLPQAANAVSPAGGTSPTKTAAA